VFFDESIKLLIDMLILQCQGRENTKLYILDNGFKYVYYNIRKDLLNIFKIKKLTCFTITKNESNSQVINEIMEKFSNFESEKVKLLYDENNIIKEFTLEK
jgi:hypothetical protein